MASEPQPTSPVPPPPATNAPPADADDEPAAPAPAGGEERKAAAALSSLDARGDDKPSGPKSEADQKALGDAMSRLEILDRGNATGKASAAGSGAGKKEAEEKKKVKINAADVTLLVEELELSKGKATELLRTHEGDALKAMRAFVRALV